jgi:hypothetical protein
VTTRQLFAALALALLAATTEASAEPKLSASGRVVRVVDVDPSAPPELAEIELCKTPPAGSSRVLTRRDMQTRVREAGADPKGLLLPNTLRVESPAERWTPEDVAGRADAAVRGALPPGVTLVKLSAMRGVVVPPGTTVTNVKPSVPRRAGRHTLTAVAELSAGDEVIARTPLSLVIDVSEASLAPLVAKGDRVTLLIQHGNARVGANGHALADAHAGDLVWFKVATTGKVLKAKVTSRDVAMVVDP